MSGSAFQYYITEILAISANSLILNITAISNPSDILVISITIFQLFNYLNIYSELHIFSAVLKSAQAGFVSHTRYWRQWEKVFSLSSANPFL